ncbi:MAG: class I SAM-dependent methyltransferase [Desulfovibrionaceae bacterium]|nr:class I SAM-dependent methyltransferase [Desulfovibrionaceae bacterium]MBF0512758.1 class I SAM-dependent methyltransferase [Desulfovibrionaceae bacterium]
MAWDATDARRYEQWFETAEGCFAFAQEVRLIESMMSSWPRRGQRLLDIGCGPGIFANVLHRDGFDVSAVDNSPVMLEAARARLGGAVDLHLADAAHLPFDDKQFDYAVLLSVLEFCDDPDAVVREAARVSRKGLLIGFLNRYSFYYYSAGRVRPGKPPGRLASARWFSPWEMRALARPILGSPDLAMRSVLAGPPGTWRFKFPFSQINGLVFYPPLGAYCALRADFFRERPLTPLAAFSTEPSPG